MTLLRNDQSQVRLVARTFGMLSCALAWAAIFTAANTAHAQRPVGRPTRSNTVPPPDWDASLRAVFFENAVEQLGLGQPGSTLSPSPAPSGSGTDEPRGDGFAWSELISAKTIEDEIHDRTALATDATATPGRFKSGAFREVRREYSVVAVMFGLITRYDADIQFRDSAIAMRDAVARAARNCKVGTDGSYSEAKQRAEDLTALLGGEVRQSTDAPPDSTWPDVADREPLMQRMEIAFRDRLKPWTGSATVYRGNTAKIVHEAELLAAFGQILSDETYDYADDETFREYVTSLKEQSLAVVRGVESNDFAAVQSAVSGVGRACADCHNDFR